MKKILFTLFLLLFCLFYWSLVGKGQEGTPLNEIEKSIEEYMNKGDIPGLSVAVVKDSEVAIRCFGFANVKGGIMVTPKTLFELGSCSKAFTALAVLKLVEENKLNLDNYVSDYISWFYVTLEGDIPKITLRQLIHHTSGIPGNTLSLIPQSNEENALERTIRMINGVELNEQPGKRFEYATINYDILALVIEKVSGVNIETYIEKEILEVLGLEDMSVGKQMNIPNMAKGYKIGFFKPRGYNAPIYKGNNAAGYIISDADHIAKWLKYQLGIIPCKFDSLIFKSHKEDKSVRPHYLTSYAYGWEVSLKGDGEISHDGLNPNFSTYIGFNKDERLGVAVLANSNSPYTKIIGQAIIKNLAGEEVEADFTSNDSKDKAFSVISIMFGMYLLFVLVFLVRILWGVLKGGRGYQPLTLKKKGNIFLGFVFLIPFLYGIYIIPKTLAGFTWEAAIVWSPISFPAAVVLCLSSIGFSYLTYVISVLFPEENKYLKDVPKIILLTIVSGLSNMVVILLITSALQSAVEFKYQLYYFVITVAVYLGSKKILETEMIFLNRGIIRDLRMKLINKVFSTSYERFEKFDKGSIYSTMNDDIGTIARAANTLIGLVTSFITAVAAFLYMAAIAFWATLLTVLVVGAISTVYFIVSRRTQPLFEDVRETRTVYLRLLSGMIDGFKELSIHSRKKMEYRDDFEATTNEYTQKDCIARGKFIYASVIGESLLLVVLATMAFAVPKIFSGIQFHTIMSFVIILLYLIGPVKAILRAIPSLMQLRIAWCRVQNFIDDIPSDLNLSGGLRMGLLNENNIRSIEVKDMSYCYGSIDEAGFSVGPVSFEVKKGELLFIIGGNGSGKTTLAKLLTGLYNPQSGKFLINDKIIASNEVGEYFSTIFNPYHLFQKLYAIEKSGKFHQLDEYLKLLQLEGKVSLSKGEYSTINLSGGQRKRLALLQCYLEDRPVYLFDEWAADQDPEYRRLFYRKLLPEMKREGKIIIAITHDDHYFDVADKVLKLDNGKVEYLVKAKEGIENVFS